MYRHDYNVSHDDPHNTIAQVLPFPTLMEENHHLLQPLLTPTTSSPPLDDHVLNNIKLISSNSGIVFRLCLVAFIGIVSIWANHEASKGYAITILNESPNTFAGTRFQLFYASNDEATRMVIKASNIIENFLYPTSIKKPIKSVTVKLVDRNLTENVIVELGSTHDQFVLNISPSIMSSTNFNRDMVVAIRRGVVRIWLWDGNAPKNLINGIVEYLANSLDSSPILLKPTTMCWDSDNPIAVAEFLNHGERRRPGFIRRLNEAIKDGKLGGALGLPVDKLCATAESLRYNSSSM